MLLHYNTRVRSRKAILPKDYRIKFESAFYIFCTSWGDTTTQEINALVDLLDGHKKEDIINRPRRLLPWRFKLL